jgi:hypothetical protein
MQFSAQQSGLKYLRIIESIRFINFGCFKMFLTRLYNDIVYNCDGFVKQYHQ